MGVLGLGRVVHGLVEVVHVHDVLGFVGRGTPPLYEDTTRGKRLSATHVGGRVVVAALRWV